MLNESQEPVRIGPSTPYNALRPLNRTFYEDLRGRLGRLGAPAGRIRLPERTGASVRVAAGDVIVLELLEGPQIVNFFGFNPRDPDERLWVAETSLLEGAFLRRYSRLWGTMARFRPLLTVLDDTVSPRPRAGAVSGKHHFLWGGSGTPADWSAGGGRPDIPSTWERLTAALAKEGLGAEMLMDNACLFQKAAIDPTSQRVELLPSDALAGDRIAFLAEIDLTLVLALSPYRDGSLPPSELDGSVLAVEVALHPQVAEPLAWPYDGMPYPDLRLYVDESGSRSDVVGPTAGLESP